MDIDDDHNSSNNHTNQNSHPHDDDDKWLRYARSLNFTDAQYREALTRIDSPENTNQLLVALIDVSSRNSDTCCNVVVNQVAPVHEQLASSLATTTVSSSASAYPYDKDLSSPPSSSSASSSCYSSITSFTPSSSVSLCSDQSLEYLHQHHQYQLQRQSASELRKIYIDGSNVARTHGKDGAFSWTGVEICVDWFVGRSHNVKVFVPAHKCAQADQLVLNRLRNMNALIKTPSGCNDDLFIIEAARQNNGVIVSNDMYRDEKRFDPELQTFIHHNRLPYVFVDDLFIPAKDPQGRSGPTLDEFLTNAPEPLPSNTCSHSKLSRTRSHQRYQKTSTFYTNSLTARLANQHYNLCNSRSLQPTRSLPIEQMRTSIGVPDVGGRSRDGSCDNQQQSRSYHQQQSNNQHYAPDSHRQLLGRTKSMAYAHPSMIKENDSQSFERKRALCGTKSHNI